MMAPDMLANALGRIDRRTRYIFGGYLLAFLLVAVTVVLGLPPLVRFGASIIALAAGAVAVGEATERLAHRLSPAATGVVQSVLGNLPELFLSIFALQAGLTQLVVAALIGSVLGNALFVLGLAIFLGGLRHGRLRFSGVANRLYATEVLLGASALLIPFLATQPGAPDFGHADELSAVVSIVLLVVFAASVPISLRLSEAGPGAADRIGMEEEQPRGSQPPPPPLRSTLLLLGFSALLAAFVADWFVDALEPAMASFGISEAFVGLIVVALAGNSIEQLAGVRAAVRNRPDLALSLILNSALQIVLFLTPVIVLLSFIVAPVPMTLVIDPLFLGSLMVTVILLFVIVADGEANALEGLMLLGLYVIIAAAVWWGHPIPG